MFSDISNMVGLKSDSLLILIWFYAFTEFVFGLFRIGEKPEGSDQSGLFLLCNFGRGLDELKFPIEPEFFIRNGVLV